MSIYVWIIAFGFLSHIAAQMLLKGYLLPLHWLFVSAGGLLGVSVGWLWQHRRDILP